MFEIGNLIFRKVEREDLKLLHEWENDFELMLYSRGKPQNMKSYDEVVKEYEENMKDDKKMHFVVEMNGKGKIGTASIRIKDWSIVKSADIGTYLSKEYWNKGLGKIITIGLLELSFYFYNMERGEACSIEYNKRAHKVLEDCGFKRCAILRKTAYVMGKKWDWYCFDILREEYEEIRENLIRKYLSENASDYLKKLKIPE